MSSLQANAVKDAISTQHARRVFLMLRIASGVLMAMGLVWAVTFTLRGDWYIVGVDILMLAVGALVWVLAGRSQIRVAFYVMFVTIFVVVSVLFLLFSFFSPYNATLSAPMPGAEVFNTTTFVATEIMHLFSGVLAIYAFTRRARAA